MPNECKPELYMTRQEHDKHCDDRYDISMEKIRDAFGYSKEDRGKLWSASNKLDTEVEDLKKLIPRFQWWFIGLLVAIIISSVLGPKYFGNNGNDAKFRELAGYIAVVTGEVERQKALIKKGNDISEINQFKLDTLEKKVEKKLGQK